MLNILIKSISDLYFGPYICCLYLHININSRQLFAEFQIDTNFCCEYHIGLCSIRYDINPIMLILILPKFPVFCHYTVNISYIADVICLILLISYTINHWPLLIFQDLKPWLFVYILRWRYLRWLCRKMKVIVKCSIVFFFTVLM